MDCFEYDQKLSELELEHLTLRFKKFNCQTALEIGLYLVEKAKEAGKSITIDICGGSQQLFHCALEGTTADNDQWVIRKNRVANYFQKSSYYISLLLKSQGKTIEEVYQLSANDYASYGGAFPLMDENGDFIGTITVSGLPDHEDHEMVVSAIRWYLSK